VVARTAVYMALVFVRLQSDDIVASVVVCQQESPSDGQAVLTTRHKCRIFKKFR
jgi:hypothetical protein